ncbi:MAG: helix-turn-helix domain-containing protein [Spirochaetales bacterium]
MVRALARLPAKRLLFISFLAAFLVPLLFGSLGYWAAASVALEQATQYHDDLLRNAEASVEGALAEFEALSRTLTATRWVNKIALMAGPDIDRSRLSVYDQSSFPMELDNYRSLNRFVERIILVFNEKNLALSASGFDSLDWFFANAWVTAGVGPEEWKARLKQWSPGEVLPTIDVVQYGVPILTIPYVRTLPILGERTPRATLLLAVRESSLRELLRSVTSIPGSAVLITDSSGRPILGDGDPSVRDVLAGIHFTSGLPASYRGPDNRPYYLFREVSSTNGWKYTAAIPTAIVMQKVDFILYVTVALLVIAVLAGILGAIFLSRSNYRPIQGLLDTTAALESKVASFLPLAVHAFFLRLLYDAVEGQELAQAEAVIGTEASGPFWSVAVLRRDKSREAGPASGLEHRLTEGSIPYYVVHLDPSRTAVVLNSADRGILETALLEFAGRAVLAGVGTPREGLASIRLSFREALATLDLAITRASPGLLYFSDQANSSALDFHYSPAAEEELLSLTRHGDFDQVKAALDALVERNRAALASTFLVRQCFTYNLLSTALKAAAGSGLHLRDLAGEFRLQGPDAPDALLEYVYESFRSVCRTMVARREGHLLKRRDAILQAIDDQALSSSLSLSSLADEFHVSVPYLSRFIKEKTGENFIDYVTRKRVNRAKEALRDGGKTIEEVARSVGYINALTFRRAFKRSEGVNPGDWLKDGLF